MNKLNWRNVNKELPNNEHGPFQKLCIVRVEYINGKGEKDAAIGYDWYNPYKEIFIDGELEYIGQWSENDGDVTHWFYADELPPPKE